MDIRRMMFALFAAIAVFYLWMWMSVRFMPPASTSQPAPATSSTRPASVTRPYTRPASGPAATEESPSIASSALAVASYSSALIKGGEDATAIVLGSTDKGGPFPMSLQIMPLGASVGMAEIRDHYRTIERKAAYPLLSPVEIPEAYGQMETFYSFAAPKIRFEDHGVEAALDRVLWKVESKTETQVVLAVRIESLDGKALARVVRTYEILPQPAGSSTTQTSDFALFTRVENLTSGPMSAIYIQQGPVGMAKENARQEDRHIVAAWWAEGQILCKGHYRAEAAKKHQAYLAKDDDTENQRIAWAAVTNNYFACIMAPRGRLSPKDPARFSTLNGITLLENTPDRREANDLTFQFTTNRLSIPPRGSTEIAFDCYLGPKSKVAFESVESYRNRDYYGVISESFSSCTPTALVGLMMSLLNTFHKIPPHNYGLAIIILVLVVRAALHPITKKSQVNMMKMQKQQAMLQPKVAQLREKYANDRVKMNHEIMEVYREAGINPAGNILSCLPMMLQIPIWIALWTALASTVDMRHAPFDGWWIRDLAGADAIYTFKQAFYIPLIGALMGGPMESINLLPILLGISQVLQTRYMPRSTMPQQQGGGMTDQMEQQRKMMMFMSVFFVFLLYNAPSGLNLYIMASNMFGLLEQWRIRQHLALVEARQTTEEALGKTAMKPRKKGWLAKKWDNLAKEAEEARKIQSEKKKRK